MAQLKTKVFLYCEANGKTVDFGKDVLLQNDGTPASIASTAAVD